MTDKWDDMTDVEFDREVRAFRRPWQTQQIKGESLHYIIDHSKVATPAEASAIAELCAVATASTLSCHSSRWDWLARAEALGVRHCLVPCVGDVVGRIIFAEAS